MKLLYTQCEWRRLCRENTHATGPPTKAFSDHCINVKVFNLEADIENGLSYKGKDQCSGSLDVTPRKARKQCLK